MTSNSTSSTRSSSPARENPHPNTTESQMSSTPSREPSTQDSRPLSRMSELGEDLARQMAGLGINEKDVEDKGPQGSPRASTVSVSPSQASSKPSAKALVEDPGELQHDVQVTRTSTLKKSTTSGTTGSVSNPRKRHAEASDSDGDSDSHYARLAGSGKRRSRETSGPRNSGNAHNKALKGKGQKTPQKRSNTGDGVEAVERLSRKGIKETGKSMAPASQVEQGKKDGGKGAN